jgi:hypothetical protein
MFEEIDGSISPGASFRSSGRLMSRSLSSLDGLVEETTDDDDDEEDSFVDDGTFSRSGSLGSFGEPRFPPSPVRRDRDVKTEIAELNR